jgi:prepilin peptidase CpaA
MSELPILQLFCVLYVLCVCTAIWTDVTSLLIPNWVSVLLAVSFIPFALMHLGTSGLLQNFAIAAVVFGVCVVFFVVGWMGGGDVKFLTATSVWMGSDQILPFLFKIAIIGAAVALVLIYFRSYANPWRGWGARFAVLGRILELADARKVPYGLPIGGAALWSASKIFFA